jgi:hypothetical protein
VDVLAPARDRQTTEVGSVGGGPISGLWVYWAR